MHHPALIEVYITPPKARVLAGAAVIVLDILRATTVHEALAAGGAGAVYPTTDFAAGAALQADLGNAKLIGEIDALPPPEADFGNSPTQFAGLDIRGWTLVHVTSNGTRALLGAAQAAQTLSGCLRNLSATVEHTLSRAPDRITVVCSGDHGGTAPSVEDSFAAGAYVDALLQAAPKAVLRGGARLALKLFNAYDRDPAATFADSPHADHLRTLGFHADLAYAAAIDASESVVMLDRDRAGRPCLRAG